MTDQCYDRHGKAELLDFLKKVAKAYPRLSATTVTGMLTPITPPMVTSLLGEAGHTALRVHRCPLTPPTTGEVATGKVVPSESLIGLDVRSPQTVKKIDGGTGELEAQ